MSTWSKSTNQFYEPDECVFFKNALQSAFYFHKGAVIKDILFDKNERKFVFAFTREEHERLKTLWNNHEWGL